MQIVIPLYEAFAPLDAVGPYQVLKHLPDTQTIFSSERPVPIADDAGSFVLQAQASFEDVSHPDIILVPGGTGSRKHIHEGPLRDWLVEADQTSAWTTSVCTGSLILAGAGLLTDRPATTHWQHMDHLADLGAKPSRERYVFAGKYVTAAGVSAGIDMAIALAARIVGDQKAKEIQARIEYDPAPPFDVSATLRG